MSAIGHIVQEWSYRIRGHYCKHNYDYVDGVNKRYQMSFPLTYIRAKVNIQDARYLDFRHQICGEIFFMYFTRRTLPYVHIAINVHLTSISDGMFTQILNHRRAISTPLWMNLLFVNSGKRLNNPRGTNLKRNILKIYSLDNMIYEMCTEIWCALFIWRIKFAVPAYPISSNIRHYMLVKRSILIF